MKDKKGFTLIELLAVVVIIGILLLIAVPAISRYLSKGTIQYYNSLEDSVLIAAREYLNDYDMLLPREIGNVTVIELNELLSNNYIDDVLDSSGNVCSGQVTAKKVSKNQYEYYSCLDCGDEYKSTEENCNFSENDNVTSETKNYTIQVEKESYTIRQGEYFELPMAKAYYLGQLVSSNVVASPRLVDTNKLGTTTITYSYKGAKKQIIVKVVDQISPSIPQIVLKHDNKNGSNYKGEWYSGNIYIEFKSTDYAKQGLQGSGISHYEISTDKKEWQQLSENNYTAKEDGNQQFYVRSVDKVGNVSEVNSFNVKIDSKTPKCKILANGKDITDKWFNSDVELSLEIEETVSGVFNKSLSTQLINTNTSGKTVTGIVTSNSGKVGTCSAVIKLDKTIPNVPTITASDSKANGSWHSSDFTLNFSGANNISGNTYYYGTTTNPTTPGTSAVINTSTNGTTYYVKVCSGAGLCSGISSYQVKLDKEGPTIPTSGAIGGVSGSNTIGTIQTAANGSVDSGIGGITYKYLVTTTSATPANTNTGFTTSRNFTRSCGTTYYAWAIAEDSLGNRSAVRYLGATSDGVNSYSSWSACSKTCGGGIQTRTNTCALITTNLSQACNTGSCNLQLTDVSGNSSWTLTGGCTTAVSFDATKFTKLKVAGTAYAIVDNKSQCHSATVGYAGEYVSIRLTSGSTVYDYNVATIYMGTSWGDLAIETPTKSFNETIDLPSNGINSANSTVQMCTYNNGIFCTGGYNCELDYDFCFKWEQGNTELGGTISSIIATN